MAKGLGSAERETTIGRCADEKYWSVYSCDPPMVRRFLKLAEKCDEVEIEQVDDFGYRFKLPLDLIEIKIPRRRQLTEDQREKLRERGRKLAAMQSRR